MYRELRYEYLMQEAFSSLIGDPMMLSGAESPTDKPFMLDAIICKSLCNSYPMKTKKQKKEMGETIEDLYK
jgi:hypothetical protein